MPQALLHCWIYRSPRREGLYLYVPAPGGFSGIPAPLLQNFGTPQLVMELYLAPGRQLARADATQVAARLRDAGYYLQMPPGPHGSARGSNLCAT